MTTKIASERLDFPVTGPRASDRSSTNNCPGNVLLVPNALVPEQGAVIAVRDSPRTNLVSPRGF